jgi:hypothetical protein
MAITISGDSPNFTSVAATTVNGVTTLNSSSGVLATQNGMTGICKAWINYKGTSTVSIRDSFNVSSVTVNGTGDYTINFTTAMPNANYAVSASAARDNPADPMICGPKGNASTYSTSAVRIVTFSDGGTIGDSPIIGVSVFSS